MEITKDLKKLINTKALTMPGVTPKRMFGGDAYLVGGKMFAFIGSMGLMVKPRPERAEELLKLPGCSRLEMRRGTPFGGWIAMDLGGPWAYSDLLASLEESYHHVRSLPMASKPRRSRTTS